MLVGTSVHEGIIVKAHIIGVLIGLIVTVGLAILLVISLTPVDPDPRQVVVTEKTHEPESTGLVASGGIFIPTTYPERWLLHYEEPDGEAARVEVDEELWKDLSLIHISEPTRPY